VKPLTLKIEPRPSLSSSLLRVMRAPTLSKVAQIAASIQEFGFNNPVLIDANNGIIAGHGRVLAARKLRLSEVPVIVLDHLTDNQKRAFMLADNRLALNSLQQKPTVATSFSLLRLIQAPCTSATLNRDPLAR
jgi:ParB-like chromosome segregation protein Spo0J